MQNDCPSLTGGFFKAKETLFFFFSKKFIPNIHYMRTFGSNIMNPFGSFIINIRINMSQKVTTKNMKPLFTLDNIFFESSIILQMNWLNKVS